MQTVAEGHRWTTAGVMRLAFAGCGALAGFGKHRARQDSIGALTDPTAIGREVVMLAEEPPIRALASWAHKPGRMAVLLEPSHIDRVIK